MKFSIVLAVLVTALFAKDLTKHEPSKAPPKPENFGNKNKASFHMMIE